MNSKVYIFAQNQFYSVYENRFILLIISALNDGNNEENLKPEINKGLMDGMYKQQGDTDLDDEAYGDQLNVLLRRITPPPPNCIEVIKRTDQQTIWDRIHGTCPDVQKSVPNVKRNKQPTAKTSRGGVFGDSFFGSAEKPTTKVFRQSIVTQTVRKPDGTYETRKTVKNGDGAAVTTITRTHEGQTQTFICDPVEEHKAKTSDEQRKKTFFLACDRNLYITESGYAVPNIFG